MKKAGNLKILNKQPVILISHYDLKAIQHIVAVAPKEAQWFHRLEKIGENGHAIYRIYEMYIPEQYCSGAEVESEPEMMMNFYKELRDEHGQDKANEIMSNLTVWCHSHHNMGVGPSGQDTKQFKEQIENAKLQKVDLPQMMMIFNKKDDYYCRLWDPVDQILYENVDLVIGSYDFSHISEQAKTKFKKPKVKPIAASATAGRSTWERGFVDWSSGWNGNNSSRKDTKKKSKKGKTTRTYQAMTSKKKV